MIDSYKIVLLILKRQIYFVERPSFQFDYVVKDRQEKYLEKIVVLLSKVHLCSWVISILKLLVKSLLWGCQYLREWLYLFIFLFHTFQLYFGLQTFNNMGKVIGFQHKTKDAFLSKKKLRKKIPCDPPRICKEVFRGPFICFSSSFKVFWIYDDVSEW